jgi:hypothetical protein
MMDEKSVKNHYLHKCIMWNRIKVWGYSTYLKLGQFYSLKRRLTKKENKEEMELRDSFDSESSTYDKLKPVRTLGIKVKVNKIKFINKKVVHPKYFM